MIALGLTLIATVDDRGWLNRGALAVSAIVIVIAVSALIGQDDAVRAEASASQIDPGEPAPGTYTMICSDGATVVCVHPAFEPMLGEASDQMNGLLLVLGEIPGKPERIDLVPVVSSNEIPGLWSHQLRASDPEADLRRAIHDLARALIVAEGVAVGAVGQNTALAMVLLVAGRPIICEGEEATDSGVILAPVSCDALNRLASLDPTERASWLTNNLPAIRNGTLTLNEFPTS